MYSVRANVGKADLAAVRFTAADQSAYLEYGRYFR